MPTPNLPQGITDPLNPGVQATACLSLTGFNTVGGIQGVGLADAVCDEKATAEWRNTVNAMLRSFCDYVQGLTPITALQIGTFFRPPVYTTAGTPAASGANDGRVIYDTTTDRLRVNANGAWASVATLGDITSGIRVAEIDGDVDEDPTTLLSFEGAVFDLTLGNPGEVTVNGLVDASVAHAKLANGSARSLFGRAANSSGVMASIAGAGADTFANDNGTTIAFRTISANQIGDQTLYSVDFSTLANNTLSNGGEVIDGFTWTIANAAAATTFAVENGTGIHFDAAASSTAYTTSSRTATNMSIMLSTLIPSWDPQRDYVIEVYFSSLTLGTNANRVLVCLENTENTGAERLMGGGRQNVSGTQRFANQNEATVRTSTPTTATDCFALKVSAGQMVVCAGTSSGGDFPSVYTHSDAMSCTNGASVQSPTALLTIAFVTGEAGGAMDAVLRRLRVRRVG